QRHLDLVVVGEFLLFDDADGYGLSEFHTLNRVRTPVDAGAVASEGHVAGDLVQLAQHCQRRSDEWRERRSVGVRNHWILDRIRLVAESLGVGRARAGDRRVARTV